MPISGRFQTMRRVLRGRLLAVGFVTTALAAAAFPLLIVPGATSAATMSAGEPSSTSQAPASSTITLGQSNADDVVVTGNVSGGSPDGTVDVYVCGPGAVTCTNSGSTLAGAPTLTAGAHNTSSASAHFTATAVGQWCFGAGYPGSATFSPSHDYTVDGCFTVTPAPSTTVSTPAHSTIMLGQSNTDTADVTGNPVGGAPTGPVTFNLCGPGVTSCPTGGKQVGGSSLLVATGSDTASATSAPVTPTAPGTYCFRAVYSTDIHYLDSSDSSADECFTVLAPKSTTTVTTPSASSVALNGSVTDGVVVTGSGGTAPTGTVTFYVCGPAASTCSQSGTKLGTVTLTAGAGDSSSATGPSYSPSATGNWCFAGFYSGDANYDPSSDASSDECFKVVNHTSSTVTTPGHTSVAVGATNTDSATVTGNGKATPTGTVQFYVCGPGVTSCDSSGTKVGSPVTLSGSGSTATATSPAWSASAPGTFCFAGYYSGDANYGGSSDTSADECFTVTGGTSPNTPNLATTPSGATAGSPANDGATVTGNATNGAPSGTITFYVCGPGSLSCAPGSGTQVGAPVALVPGAGNVSSATSASWTPTVPGAYCYGALYTPATGSPYVGVSTANECFSVGQLTLTKSYTPPGSTHPGAEITYWLVLQNTGGAASQAVTINDGIPAGTTYVASTASCNGASGCSASETGNVVTFAVSSVAAYAKVTMSFSVTVNAGQTATINNTASFGGPNCTTGISCSSNMVQTPIGGPGPLASTGFAAIPVLLADALLFVLGAGLMVLSMVANRRRRSNVA
jgi:uncharacterized repeat protein (TIGR01451 family)